MAILKTTIDTGPKRDRETLRIFPVTAKLTRQERKAVTDFARAQGIARGQWIRDAVLAALGEDPVDQASLAEVLGIRLLLVNVLRPLAAGQKITPDTFDKLLDEISTAKHELARKLISEGGR
ncbi:MAG TPA: hypothetical protein VGF88_16980 [Acidobacteriaceae bacterium]|jgi:hypothetical protein